MASCHQSNRSSDAVHRCTVATTTEVCIVSILMYFDAPLPDYSRVSFTPTEKELSEVEKMFAVEGFGKHLVIPKNFAPTVTPFAEGSKTDYSAGRYVRLLE